MAYTMMQTPRGTKDFLPRDVERKRWIEEHLRNLFWRWGYREIITPTMEFYDAVSAGDAAGLAGNVYRFFEREGDILALRPDMTTPIARVVATRLQGAAKPLRLCYHANVFRYAEPQAGRRREFYQSGVELVGSSSHLADAEVIALTVESLKAVGLRNFRVDIGHVDYYDGILQNSGLSPDKRRNLRMALLKKDYVALEELTGVFSLSQEDRELLLRLPHLRGGREILAEAMERAANPISQRAISNLTAIYDALEAYGLTDWIHVDLGLIKDIEYYTGMVLEAYTADMGFTIGTGGRYDHLIQQFGYGCPATGFALGIERIMLALSRQGGWTAIPNLRVLCLGVAEKPKMAWQVAEKLRTEGFSVELAVNGEGEGEILQYAAAQGFCWVIQPLTPERIRVWTEADGWREQELSSFAAPLEGEGAGG
ncbi:MAG: ATP phosphoribosyltransferase regulatory subunit [Firmicutes bacterium]|nr:ATP phosphoribosyltransferase regulatory subunit [Bacillota bacterium]